MKNRDEKFELDIKECLKNEAYKVSASENMFFKVRNEILRKDEKRNFNMKNKFLRPKTALIAGVICVLTTVTCVAATNLSGWYSSSSKLTEIKTFPTEKIVQDKVGFTPKYVESFSNGFKFKTFNYSNNEIKNEKGDDVDKFKGADFEYTRDGYEKNQYLNISAEKIDQKYIDENKLNNVATENYNGITIEYTSNQYKAVPEGYEPSEEEKELENKGLLQIGYGSNEIEVSQNQAVIWYEDGISYCILNSNYNDLDKEDMINMAIEVINQN
ncbi:hypothetical protein [Clostridium butyricum]|uniref:DUF4367 domain-containing protein n=1 Tax=Clostridium butyricum TaxID=1492 RepID=A0A2S7FE67_CLOBU|nr:hypothetical protein [Clostridium butyricum]KHD15616.1 hypothetical protein OA81_08910 [Clostridium butyricum]PPV16980.1 hypothetical protein AWN73_09020 [Clostridium butyricum]